MFTYSFICEMHFLTLVIGEQSLNMMCSHGWRSWLRHCTTGRKVAGSVPDGVFGIFPSGRAVALGSTQPLTEMSTRRPVRRADSLPIVMKSGSLNLRIPQDLSRTVQELLYLTCSLISAFRDNLLSLSLEEGTLSVLYRHAPEALVTNY